MIGKFILQTNKVTDTFYGVIGYKKITETITNMLFIKTTI